MAVGPMWWKGGLILPNGTAVSSCCFNSDYTYARPDHTVDCHLLDCWGLLQTPLALVFLTRIYLLLSNIYIQYQTVTGGQSHEVAWKFPFGKYSPWSYFLVAPTSAFIYQHRHCSSCQPGLWMITQEVIPFHSQIKIKDSKIKPRF